MNEVFISYSRRNESFVVVLQAALERAQRSPWMDKGQIRGAEDWMAAIHGAIESADALIFVITPDSASSRVCIAELEHALACNKRLIPVLLEPTPDENVPEALRRLNYLNFCNRDRFDESFAQLIETLDTDLDWVRLHTRYLVRALQWEERGRKPEATLRGSELELMQQWFDAAPGKAPAPTDLHRRYIGTSRRVSARRRRQVILGVSTALALTSVLAIVAFVQRNEALRQGNISDARMHVAAGEAIFPAEPLPGLATALSGWRLVTHRDPDVAEALAGRVSALARQGRLRRLGTDVSDLYRTPNGRYLLVANQFSPARLIDSTTLELVDEISGVALGAPVPVGDTDTYFAIPYRSSIDRFHEIRRSSDAKLTGRTRRITPRTLFPADSPRFVYADVGLSPKVLRIDDGSDIGKPGYDIARFFYESGWPVFALVYRDDENTRKPPPPELFDVSSGAVIATFEKGLSQLEHGPRGGESCFLVTNKYNDSELRAASRPGEILVSLSDYPAQVSFAPTVSGRFVLIAFDDRFDVRRCTDGHLIGSEQLSVTRVRGQSDAPSWQLETAGAKGTWTVDVVDQALIVQLVQDHERMPVEDEPTSHSQTRSVAAEATPELVELTETRLDEDDSRSKLSTLRRRHDGFVIYKTRDQLRDVRLLPEYAPSYVRFKTRNSDDESRLRLHRIADGEPISGVGNAKELYFAPTATAPYVLLDNGKNAGTILWLDGDGKSVKLSAAIDTVSWSDSGENLHFVIRFRNGHSELWRGLPSPRKLLDLGLGYASHLLLDSGRELIIRYTDGRAIVVDSDWLDSMTGLPATAATEDVAALLCNVVLSGPWGRLALARADPVTGTDLTLACPSP